MQAIKYTFADGTTSEVEVSDELYALHLQLLQADKRNHWLSVYLDSTSNALYSGVVSLDMSRQTSALATILTVQRHLTAV